MKKVLSVLALLTLLFVCFTACDVESRPVVETGKMETHGEITSDVETDGNKTDYGESSLAEDESSETATIKTEPDVIIEVSEIETTETEVPETEVPETEVPETEVPETEVPETEVPETEVPETEVPETEVPTTETPETETAAPVHTHAWTAWSMVKAPTCVETGINERNCACGEVEQEPIAALGHIEVEDAAVAATCTTPGLTSGTHCSVCNEILVPQIVSMPMHEYVDGYCVMCSSEHEPTDGLIYQWYSANEKTYQGYYVTGIEEDCTASELYIPSSWYTEEHGVSEVVGICQDAFKENYVIKTVYFPKSMKIVESYAFGGVCNRKFYLNEGLEVLRTYSLGYVEDDLHIPSSVKCLEDIFAINMDAQYGNLAGTSAKLIFEGDFPEKVSDWAFDGLIVVYNPDKKGWPGENGVTMCSGVLYRSDYDPELLYNDDVNAQMAIATDLCYQTALNAYSDWATMDWTQLRVVDSEEKYNYFCALASEITQGCTTDKERIGKIFNWVRDNIIYDMDAMYYDMYDAVIEKRGVCAQFATIMLQLLRCLNIPSMYVDGYLWDGFTALRPKSTKWADANWLEGVDGEHSWLIAYDGEEWATYDPTNNWIFKEYNDAYAPLFPVAVEGLAINGEGYYPYRYGGVSHLFMKNNQWFYKTEIGYTIPVYDYDKAYIIGGHGMNGGGGAYSQATTTAASYRIQFEPDGDMVTGLTYHSGTNEDNTVTNYYYYILPNGRCLTSIALTIDGVVYEFDGWGCCAMTVPMS